MKVEDSRMPQQKQYRLEMFGRQIAFEEKAPIFIGYVY